MVKKAEKLYQKAKNSKTGWSVDDLITLYEGFGFIVRQARGSHVVVRHPDHKELSALIGVHDKELGKKYISNAVKNITRAIELDKEQESNE